MSICPKNKTSKARRDKRRANWKMEQMWCADDASQSMQSLWFLQQERNRFSGSLIQAIRKQIRMGLLFLYGKQETISSTAF